VSTADYDRIAELRDVYQDLAWALGAAYRETGGPPTEVEDRVARLWTLAVLRSADEGVDPSGVPATVEPDLDAPDGFDVAGCLHHVAGAVEPADAPPDQVDGRTPTVRTAALAWVAAAGAAALLLGVTGSGPVVVPAFVPAIATGLLAAYLTIRGPGALWAVGLASLVFLLAGAGTSWAAVVMFVVLVAGFGYILWLAGQQDPGPRARRRPLELGLVLYTLAAMTVRTDVVAIVFVCCVGALLWRRRWTALVAAAVCGFTALGPSILPPTLDGGTPPDVLTYLVLTAGWLWAAFNLAWLNDPLKLTEWGVRRFGRGARAAYRTAQRYTALPQPQPRVVPSGPDGMGYCWTCHQRKPHIAPATSPAICADCLRRAGRRTGEPLHRQWCDRCARFQPFTHRGCLRCWETGARS
jgi:hypothetical protein